MIIILIVLCLTAIYSYLFSLINLSLWFYFLWVPVSLILSVITLAIVIDIMFQYMKRTSPKGRFRHHLLRQACQAILICTNIHVKIYGKENIPNETFVCYSNHKSDFDPIIIYNSLKCICSAVGKKSLFSLPVVKQCKDIFHAIPLDRDNDREAAKQIIETIRAIKDGLSYIIFPEGGIKTRQTEQMTELRAGAYKLVTKTDAVLLPITILGTSGTKKRGLFIIKPIKAKVIIHKPIYASEYQDKTTTEIGQMVMDIINKDVIENENKGLN